MVVPHPCLLVLGSNQGNRLKRLRQAVRSLKGLRGCRVLAASRVYETAPVGPRQRRFLNCAVRIETTLTPIGLLVELKRLEVLAGRRPGPRWGPRPLDIDIADFGNRNVTTRWLRIPHPLLWNRAFALAPLADLAPSLKLRKNRTVLERLRQLRPDRRTVKIWGMYAK